MAPDKPAGSHGGDPRTPAKKPEKKAPARRTREEAEADKRNESATSTEGATSSTAGATTSTEQQDAADDSGADDDSANQITGQPEVVARPEEAKSADRGRVSVITLQQGVMHRQRAEGVDKLQEALGLEPSGYPDDTLTAAIAAYRKEHDLGSGSVDVPLLQHLGFDVVTV
jgi:hypothetical protein